MSFQNAKQREVQERSLMTGVGPFTPVLINPTKEQLVELLKTENINEPVYINEKETGKTTRIDIWGKVDNQENYAKISFFLDHNAQASQSGNFLFINNYLQSTYGKSLEEVLGKVEGNADMSWFKTKNLRVAYGNSVNGELSLLEFFTTLCSIDFSEEGISFENMNAILNGDVTELRNIIAHFSKEEPVSINVLYGVRVNEENGKTYQEIYTKKFANHRSKRFDFIIKAANEEYGGFKHDFGGDSKFKVYAASSTSNDAEETAKESVKASW